MRLRELIKTNSVYKYFAATMVATVAGVGLFTWAVHIDTPEPAQNAEVLATTSCTPDAKLVNPCRPWLGAAAGGYPMVASDINSQLNFFNKRLNDTSVLTSPTKAVTLNKKMDMAHVYHPQGSNLFSGSATTVLNNGAFSQIMVNWKPLPNGYKWADAGGGNSTVNSYIRTGANNVKALGNRKIILSVWHEPENDVSSGNCTSNASGAAMGSPAQYVAMWRNVRKIFDEQGVTNVVWAMNYMGFTKWNCLVPLLWPGNSYVDWILYDPYANAAETFDDSVDDLYNYLKNNSNSTYNYTSKPWGLAEHGYWFTGGSSTDANSVTYWNQAKTAIQQNKFPNLKMYLVFDTSTNGSSQVGLTSAGAVHTAEQAAYNGFADAIFAKEASAPPAPSGDTTQPGVSFREPGNNSTVSKVITVTVDASDNVGVTRVQMYADATIIKDDKDASDGWWSRWDTTKIGDGNHTLKAIAYDAAGNSRTTTITIAVKNGNTSSGGGSAPTPTVPPTQPAPVVQTPNGTPVVNAQEGGAVKQGDLVVLDPTLITDPEVLKSIQKVEFYEGDTLLQTATEEPFALDTSSLAPGAHTLRQVTYFKDGSTEETSQTVTIEEALGSDPAAAASSKRKKTWIYVASGFGLLGLGAGGYFGYRFWMRRKLVMGHFPKLPGHEPGDIDLPSSQAGQVIQPTDQSKKWPW